LIDLIGRKVDGIYARTVRAAGVGGEWLGAWIGSTAIKPRGRDSGASDFWSIIVSTHGLIVRLRLNGAGSIKGISEVVGFLESFRIRDSGLGWRGGRNRKYGTIPHAFFPATAQKSRRE
jgi:hypothetical protein